MKKHILLIVMLLFGQRALPAPVSEYDLKATYLYNFMAFTDWPSLPPDTINLCVLGRDNFGNSLRTVEGKTLHGKTLVVARLSSLSTIKKCHLLYVAEKEASGMRFIFNELGDSPVMVVTDTPVPSGATINLYSEGQKLLFDINNARAKSSNLAISSKLLQYSKPMPLALP